MFKSETSPPTKPRDSPREPEGAVLACPVEVKVKINLSPTVACPGHAHKITATATPAGGTYKWTVSGGTAQLVNSAGSPTTVGDTVYLRAFKPNDADGNIPAQTATVGVTYTHPQGTDKDSKPITIHKIDFVVRNKSITSGLTAVTEMVGGVQIGAVNAATVSTDPEVEIKLDAKCPRKGDCAATHHVGWLQTVITNDRRARYTHTLVKMTVALPIRDRADGAFPFYSSTMTFSGNNDKQVAHHEDSPSLAAPWIDQRPAAPPPPPAKNRKLRKLFFTNGFKAWLVVQNIEWGQHHLKDSFAFLGNFGWTAHMDLTVDTTKPVGTRCTPQQKAPTVGTLQKGKGGSSPVLSVAYPNRDHRISTTAAPEI